MNKTKFKIFILTLAIVTLGAFFIKYDNDESKELESNNSIIDNYVDLAISDEIKKLDEELIENIKQTVKDNLSSTKNEDKAKANYILGCLDTLNGENEKAIKKLGKAAKLLDYKTTPKLKVWINYQLSETYMYNGDYDKSNELYNKAIEICKKEYTKEGLVDLYMRGSLYKINTPGGMSEAIKLSDEALDLAKEINYKLAYAYSNAGVTNAMAGNTIHSIQYQLLAIDLAKEKGIKDLEVKNIVDIAINYVDLGNYDEAIRYLKESLKYTTDGYLQSYAMVNLTEAYIEINDIENAKKTLESLEKNIDSIKEKNKREDTITLIHLLKSKVSLKENKPLEAKKILDIAKERYESNYNSFTYLDFDIFLTQEYGNIYYELNDFEQALTYHKQAESVAIERGNFYYEAKHTKKIYLDYQALHDYENATKYMSRYIEIQNNVSKDYDIQYTQYLHKKFEDEKKQEQISSLEYNKKVLQIVVISLIVVSVIMLIMAIYIHKKNKEINKLNKLFKNLSVTDGLTGIPNRRALDEYLAGNWALYRKTQMPISFVMIDIDYFKPYNDNYGHQAGDRALEVVSKGIKDCCESSDFVARYGGEEFTVIMLNTDKEEAINRAEKIRENIRLINIRHEYSKVSDRVTLSIGISTAYINTNKDYNDYIKKADKALYEAKNNGRNNCVFFN